MECKFGERENKFEIMQKYLEQSVKVLITDTVEEEIKKEVDKFTKMLLDRKDEYISQIMKGIRIIHEKDPYFDGINYRIIFENVKRLEINR